MKICTGSISGRTMLCNIDPALANCIVFVGLVMEKRRYFLSLIFHGRLDNR